MDTKGKMINFKADSEYLRKIDQLSEKLNLDRSKAIRAALDLAIEKYVTPGFNGEFVIIPWEAYEDIHKGFFHRLNRYEADAKITQHLRKDPAIGKKIRAHEYRRDLNRIRNSEGKEAAERFITAHPDPPKYQGG